MSPEMCNWMLEDLIKEAQARRGWRRNHVEAPVRQQRELCAAAFEHTEAGAARAGVETEDADVGGRGW